MTEGKNDSSTPGLLGRAGRGLVKTVIVVLFGFALLMGGFLVLVWGEAKVNIAKTIERSPNANDVQVDGNGAATFTGSLAFLRPADEPLLTDAYAYVHRHVDTCSWVEKRVKQRGGGTKLVYKKLWTANVADSNQFETTGYDNPKPNLESKTTIGAGLTVGEYTLAKVTDFVSPDAVAPKKRQVPKARFVDQLWAYLAVDKNCKAKGDAAVGDQRIRFDVMREGDLVTVFGRMDKGSIAPYRGQILLARGDRAVLINQMRQERSAKIWIYRVSGALILWVALFCIIRPVLALVVWIPILGTLVKSAASTVTLLGALVATACLIVMDGPMSFFTQLFGGLMG